MLVDTKQSSLNLFFFSHNAFWGLFAYPKNTGLKSVVWWVLRNSNTLIANIPIKKWMFLCVNEDMCVFPKLWDSSVQFSCSVVSDSLWPHESQHTRPPCPSPTPGVHSDSCPSSQWYHPAISSSVVPFSSCPQTLPASESFPMSQLFTWGGQKLEFQL